MGVDTLKETYSLKKITGKETTGGLFLVLQTKKSSSLITPCCFIFSEEAPTRESSFLTFSVINREEGIFIGYKNIGPGNMTSKFYYKENGNILSCYVLLRPYISLKVIYGSVSNLSTVSFEEQNSTSVEGMTEVYITE